MMLLNAVIAEASIGGNLATALTSEKLWVNIFPWVHKNTP